MGPQTSLLSIAWRMRAVQTIRDGIMWASMYGSKAALMIGPDLPLLLAPGTFALTTWLEQRDANPTPSLGECSTQHTFEANDDVLLQAVFDRHETCSWSDAAQPSFDFRDRERVTT